ncbi:mammaglobin-A [Cricetulus griseus]|uniref:Mammaglobin-A n=1 Tax=Cricetulus griseus TaxID=10029 RepID=A0A9J7GUR6_CRIGR|nr:mammaglobin-A [Cricetulus griseus]XP_035315909.1 mammaglobin-A [Cricetulus griseus]
MKLVMVFMLASIPICCYASSGCNAMDDAIAKTIDKDMSLEEYNHVLSAYIFVTYDKTPVEKFKQCFLDQPRETLENVNRMMLMETIIETTPGHNVCIN